MQLLERKMRVRRSCLAAPFWILLFLLPTANAQSADPPDLTKQPTLYVVGYAHLDTDPLRRASDAIGGRIAAALDGKRDAVVLLTGRRSPR